MFLIFIALVGLSTKMVVYQLSSGEMATENSYERIYNHYFESKSKNIEYKHWLKKGEKTIENVTKYLYQI